jgi:transposase-like protein
MVRPGREKLVGIVEVDETLVGGEGHGKRGRGSENKTLVVIAVEDTGGEFKKGMGRIRLQRVQDASSVSLIEVISKHVEPGSMIRTDGWRGYNTVSTNGFGHVAVPSHELVICHLVASLMKRWLIGTYQGAVRPKHLDYYLDEYTFRFNRRNSGSRGKLFFRLVQQAVATSPLIGRDIIGGKTFDLPKQFIDDSEFSSEF